MLKQLFQKLKSLHNGSLEYPVIGSIYILGTKLFFKRCRRDSAGNDYAFDVIEVPEGAEPTLLGNTLLKAVEVSSEPGQGRGDDRGMLWQQCMEKMGCRSWRQLFSRADYFFVYGKKGQFIKLSPSAKEDGNFVGVDESLGVTVAWEPQAIGEALRKLLADRK